MVYILDLLLEEVLLDLSSRQVELQLVNNIIESGSAIILVNVASTVGFNEQVLKEVLFIFYDVT